jgi:hypothetical protein
MPKERHGAAHRITATRKQDQSGHHQVTRAPADGRVIPAVWSGSAWTNDAGSPYSADEVEAMGLDPSLRTM